MPLSGSQASQCQHTERRPGVVDDFQELTTANSRLEDALKEVASALARADRAEAAVEEFCVTSKRMQAELDQANERMLAASDAKAGLVAQMAGTIYSDATDFFVGNGDVETCMSIHVHVVKEVLYTKMN